MQHTRNYQDHNFALASGQQLVPLSQLAKLALLLAHHPVAIQGLMDRIQQVLIAEWLGEKLYRTGFHGLHTHGNISMTGDKDDRNLEAGVSQLALKIKTVDAGKSHVQNQATWSIRPRVAQEFLRSLESLRTQANRLQHALYGRTHQGVVINDKHCGSCFKRHSVVSTWVWLKIPGEPRPRTEGLP